MTPWWKCDVLKWCAWHSLANHPKGGFAKKRPVPIVVAGRAAAAPSNREE